MKKKGNNHTSSPCNCQHRHPHLLGAVVVVFLGSLKESGTECVVKESRV